jgi:hypothetical protein
MPVERSTSASRITLKPEYVLPIVNQKSIGPSAISILLLLRTL